MITHEHLELCNEYITDIFADAHPYTLRITLPGEDTPHHEIVHRISKQNSLICVGDLPFECPTCTNCKHTHKSQYGTGKGFLVVGSDGETRELVYGYELIIVCIYDL
jgi:hypothetical protein